MGRDLFVWSEPMATPTLRELPSIKRRIKPMHRWLKHIQDVYNECNVEFLKRPEVIEAFNRLYDRIQYFEHSAILEFPSKMFYYFSGIIPYYKVVAPYRRSLPKGYYYVINIMYSDTFNVNDGNETIIPLAGMPRTFRPRTEVEILLGVQSLKGTQYERGGHAINMELTLLYKTLYDLVRAELEPILLKKMDEVAAKYRLATIKKQIDQKHAQRERVERNYHQQTRSIDVYLDALYNELHVIEKQVNTITASATEK